MPLPATPRTPAPAVRRAAVVPTLSAAAREVTVPSSRFSRVAQFGSLGLSLGLGAVGELGRRVLGGGGSGSAVMSDANMQRLVATLCRVRGAALKLGQMISMQEELLPPAVFELFERVRQSADYMPQSQQRAMMAAELGDSWRDRFAEFDEVPFAAASIGQVHRAVLHDGRTVAVKVQYPGVADSIESDIANLQTLLSLAGFLPRGLFVDQLMAVAREELKMECDYTNEAAAMTRFGTLLADEPSIVVPQLVPDLSTKRVLTATFENGTSMDKTFQLSQTTRDKIAERMLRVCLRETFEFQFMQTDPNWANFLYDVPSDKLVLVDFGASRNFSREFIHDYGQIIKRAAAGDREGCIYYSKQAGFLSDQDSQVMIDAHVQAVFLLARPFASPRPFDFAKQDVTAEVRRLIPTMLTHRRTAPPRETYSLHRKLSGAFLLCTKLRARIECRDLFHNVFDKAFPASPDPSSAPPAAPGQSL